MDQETNMKLTIELDYRKTWDRKTAEIIRMVKSLDMQTLTETENNIRLVYNKFWERKNAQNNPTTTTIQEGFK